MDARGAIELSRAAHERSDKDFALDSLHHTLGKGAFQAAPGNHKHGVEWGPWIPWVAAGGTFASNITPYPGWREPSCRISNDGVSVQLRGLIQVITTAYTASANIASLPAKYAPKENEIFASGTDTGAVQQFARININNSSGVMLVTSSTAMAVGAYLTFSGIFYSTDPSV